MNRIANSNTKQSFQGFAHQQSSSQHELPDMYSVNRSSYDSKFGKVFKQPFTNEEIEEKEIANPSIRSKLRSKNSFNPKINVSKPTSDRNPIETQITRTDTDEDILGFNQLRDVSSNGF